MDTPGHAPEFMAAVADDIRAADELVRTALPNYTVVAAMPLTAAVFGELREQRRLQDA